MLVARNREKLEAVARLIPAGRQTRVVVADFSRSFERGFFDEVARQVEDLDISLLVNNVGVDLFCHFETADEKLLMDNITVNTIPVTMLTRKLIGKMLARKPRSGILNVASLAAKYPHPYYHVYSATKAYVIELSRVLRHEFPQLDVLVLNPSEVSTNMTFNRQPDM